MINNKFASAILTFLVFISTTPIFVEGQIWCPGHAIGTTNRVYNYSYTQTPAQIIEIYPAAIPNTGLTYQWYSSANPVSGFSPISGANASSYQPPALTTASVNMYYYRTSSSVALGTITSNTIKIKVVSVNWEDVNYVRQHEIVITGQTSWTSIDQLSIGSKFQTTNYLDGLGRSVQKVSKQTATPANGISPWGDIVQFSQYDNFGREPNKYLTYSTTNQPGSFKTSPQTDQAAYYANSTTYNETYPYNSTSYDNSPLNRVSNAKESGYAWFNSSGSSATYDMNTTTENVQKFSVPYSQGSPPNILGAYPANTLKKNTYTDVNNNQVIEYINKQKQIILKKIQAVPSPSVAHSGWLCTYYIYDDFGLLSYQIQPEGVKYLDANGWSFSGSNGATVLSEQVFQYYYDSKGRLIWKKAPGSVGVNMIYDIRDRVVFDNDGNQQTPNPSQYLLHLYDELDRPVITSLYNNTSNKSIATLQSAISSAPSVAPFTIANSGTSSVTTTLSYNPLSSTDLNTSTICTILKYSFYDNYSFSLSKSFNSSFTNLNAYNTSDPNVLPIVTSKRTYNNATGQWVRILGSSVFLTSTYYYDEKGGLIQILEDNIKSGTDVTTNQYYFDGRLISTCNSHTNTAAGYTSFITLNKYIFDILGRVTSIQKQLGSNPMKAIANYDYDDLDRVKTKHLDPNYNNPNSGLSDLESLNYSFNLHNQISGINKDYANKNPTNYSKWGHFFGLYLGYDNRDNVFNSPQLNGQVTGVLWNSLGDDAQRKYDFTYDNARRIVKAAFNQQQHLGDGWSNGSMDFSVSGTSGQITYDNNGNLLTMLQKGVIPGTPTPFTIDDLRYTYNAYSNKLQYISDLMTNTNLNGQFGDFIDGSNLAGTPDYVYDNSGNIVVDLNKNSQSLNNGAAGTPGIHYNYLNKPDQIRIVGKGTILIVYSADGDKLQRAFIPEAGGSSTVTTYINQYIYQETATLTPLSAPPFNGTGIHLAYLNFEEGRIRAVTTTSTNNGYDAMSENGNITLPGTDQTGAWDYFIMDYQQNVRMILTEETHSALNDCTMEITSGRPAAEDPIFGQTGSANEVEATRLNKPTAWTGNTSLSVSHLGNLSGHNLGPNTLQKVMAGDLVSAQADYYYQSATGGNNSGILSTVVSNLLSLIGNGPATVGTLTHGVASNITTQLNSSPGFVSAVTPAGSGGNTPQAYLTLLFFDERFNLILATDGGVAQQQVASSVTAAGLQLTQNLIKAPKNGYVYVYLSNRSDQDVYFDNFKVTISAGNIIEENHYYPFGLRISSISSKKLGDVGEGKLSNPYQYNDKEMLDEDMGLNWYDYGFRNFDPQIGKFTQLDPLTDYYPELSPYQFTANDPIANVDLDGKEAFNVTSAADALGNANVIVGTGGQTATFLGDLGSESSNWLSHLDAFTITAKIPAKVVPSLLKPVLTMTLRVSVQTVQLVDNVTIGKPPPVQSLTVKQKEVMSVTLHDQLDPSHAIAFGNGNGAIFKDEKTNLYVRPWKPEAIEEDNGFWLSAAFIFVPGGDEVVMGAEAKEIEEGIAVTKSYKTFTRGTFRENLQIKTGVDGAGLDAHHILPQKFETFFERAGINIHDPKYASWWERIAHRRGSRAYNIAWTRFIRDNPNATITEIENFGNSLGKIFGY